MISWGLSLRHGTIAGLFTSDAPPSLYGSTCPRTTQACISTCLNAGTNGVWSGCASTTRPLFHQCNSNKRSINACPSSKSWRSLPKKRNRFCCVSLSCLPHHPSHESLCALRFPPFSFQILLRTTLNVFVSPLRLPRFPTKPASITWMYHYWRKPRLHQKVQQPNHCMRQATSPATARRSTFHS